jgi:hypothetical protein
LVATLVAALQRLAACSSDPTSFVGALTDAVLKYEHFAGPAAEIMQVCAVLSFSCRRR